MATFYLNHESELYHYGVKGMKWGEVKAHYRNLWDERKKYRLRIKSMHNSAKKWKKQDKDRGLVSFEAKHFRDPKNTIRAKKGESIPESLGRMTVNATANLVNKTARFASSAYRKHDDRVRAKRNVYENRDRRNESMARMLEEQQTQSRRAREAKQRAFEKHARDISKGPVDLQRRKEKKARDEVLIRQEEYARKRRAEKRMAGKIRRY